MNIKRFLISLAAVYFVLEITKYLIHGIILYDTYSSDAISYLFRNTDDLNARIWIMYIMDIIWSFFFVFFFARGYENKGIWEGLRFGLYIGIFCVMVKTYNSYVVYPLPYSLAFRIFIYGIIQVVILGIVISFIYKPKK